MDHYIKISAKDPTAHPPLRKSFLHDEDGTILFFGVIMLIVMFMLAGMGVDIMRFESTRTDLQQTADRASLAATSQTQTLNAEEVVRDYFDKAGLGDKLTYVKYSKIFNLRTTRTEARANTNPIFLRLYSMSAVNQIEARALSVAEQVIGNVEISLVLDVSGSMAGSKLTNLKTSAKEFVRTVLEADSENKISISIVPYNGQVNMTQSFQNLFTGRTNDHNVANVNCFDLPPSVYTATGLDRTLPLPVTGHVDTRSTSGKTGNYVSPPAPSDAQLWCPPSTKNVILPPTNVEKTLTDHIDALTAVGATSINAGMKWGMALLDPGSQALVTGTIAAGATPVFFQGRPFAYKTENLMKVVVLMTDGEHFPEERLNNGYRTEMSPIYYYSSGKQFSIFHQSKMLGTTSSKICSSRPYYVPHLNAWHSRPWNGSTPSNNDCYVPGASSGATQQTWDQVWAKAPVPWVAGQLYRRALGVDVDDKIDEIRSLTPTSTMDTQLATICNRARDNGIIVYGIAFEAPPGSSTMLRNCSSSDGHFFPTQGQELQTAFRAVASNISQLRLTQ